MHLKVLQQGLKGVTRHPHAELAFPVRSSGVKNVRHEHKPQTHSVSSSKILYLSTQSLFSVAKLS